MLSGRYRTEMLARHWSSNKSGLCLTPTCRDIEEDLAHILVSCPSYQQSRIKLQNLWLSCKFPYLRHLLATILICPESELLQFILDPSVHPKIIVYVQNNDTDILRAVFHLTWTWCYTIHRQRAKLLGRWP